MLNFDELQGGPGADASAEGASAGKSGGGAGGTGGTSGGSGGSSGTSGSSGTGGVVDATSEEAGPPQLALSDAAQAFAQAACADIQACYGPLAEIIYHDEDCVSFFSDVFAAQVVGPIEVSIQTKGITYDPVKAAACVNAVVTDAQSTPPRCNSLDYYIEQCKAALSNLSDAGTDCNNRFECLQGLYCNNMGGCPGKCTQRAAAGTPCTQDLQCADGFKCANAPADSGVDAGTKICQAYIPHGDACEGLGSPCEPGTICLGNACSNTYDVFTLNQGQQCFNNGLLCNPGLYCELQGFLGPGICKVEVPLTQPCKVSLPDECEKGAYCKTPLFSVDGTCVALPINGQPCATDFMQSIGLDARCAATYACTNGLCRPRAALGEPCTGSEQCVGGVCAPGDAGTNVCMPATCI